MIPLTARVTIPFRRVQYNDDGFRLADVIIPMGVRGKIVYQGPALDFPGIENGTDCVLLMIKIENEPMPYFKVAALPRNHVVIERPKELSGLPLGEPV
jgi:hypothetical protein